MSAKFVAVNYISADQEYIERFEYLFSTRAKAIDTLPGFLEMEVLRPTEDGGDYLIVSRWESEEAFKAWVGSEEFIEGHRRGFADLEEAKRAGKTPPMKSSFKTYTVLAN